MWNQLTLKADLNQILTPALYDSTPSEPSVSFWNSISPILSAERGQYNLPLNVLRASLVAQTVKNPPAMQEAQVQSLSQEDSLEKGMATHSSIFAWSLVGYNPRKSRTRLRDKFSLSLMG